MKVWSKGQRMFKRYYVIKRKYPEEPHGKLRDICGLFIIGIRNKFLFSAILCGSKDFAEMYETCRRNDGAAFSCGFVLLALAVPALFLKLLSGGIPPFLTGRMTASIILTIFGIISIISAKGGMFLFIGISVLSYSYALGETTYSQYAAFFNKKAFNSWTFGSILSNLFGGITYIIVRKYGIGGVIFSMLAPPFLEILAYSLIIKRPVQVEVVVVDREVDNNLDNDRTEVWQPASLSDQVENFRRFFKPILCYNFILWMSYFNLQGTFEILSLKGTDYKTGYRLLCIVYFFGSILGACAGAVIQMGHIWILMILEACTTSTFLIEVFYKVIPYNALLGLALFEGILIAFSYINLLSYLSNKIDHKYSQVVAFNILSVLESFFCIFAAFSILALHKIVCLEKIS